MSNVPKPKSIFKKVVFVATLSTFLGLQAEAKGMIGNTRPQVMQQLEGMNDTISDLPENIVLSYANDKQIQFQLEGTVEIFFFNPEHIHIENNETDGITTLTLSVVSGNSTNLQTKITYRIDGGATQVRKIDIYDHPIRLISYTPPEDEFTIPYQDNVLVTAEFEMHDTILVRQLLSGTLDTVYQEHYEKQVTVVVPHVMNQPKENYTYTEIGITPYEIYPSKLKYSSQESRSWKAYNEIKDEKFNVYPIPTKTRVTVESQGATFNKVEILDSQGNIIKQQQNDGGTKMEIDTDNLPGGVYFIRTYKPDGTFIIRKIIIQKNAYVPYQDDGLQKKIPFQLEDYDQNVRDNNNGDEEFSYNILQVPNTFENYDYSSRYENYSVYDEYILPELLSLPLIDQRVIDNIQASNDNKTLWAALGGNNGNTWNDIIHILHYLNRNNYINFEDPALARPNYKPAKAEASDEYKRVKKWDFYIPNYQESYKELAIRNWVIEGVPHQYIESFKAYKKSNTRKQLSEEQLLEVEFVQIIVGANYLSTNAIDYLKKQVLDNVQPQKELPKIKFTHPLTGITLNISIYKDENGVYNVFSAGTNSNIDKQDFEEEVVQIADYIYHISQQYKYQNPLALIQR